MLGITQSITQHRTHSTHSITQRQLPKASDEEERRPEMWLGGGNTDLTLVCNTCFDIGGGNTDLTLVCNACWSGGREESELALASDQDALINADEKDWQER